MVAVLGLTLLAMASDGAVSVLVAVAWYPEPGPPVGERASQRAVERLGYGQGVGVQ